MVHFSYFIIRFYWNHLLRHIYDI